MINDPAEEINQLSEALEAAEEQIEKLWKSCRKYRLALNRIAHPESNSINQGYEIQIAVRALMIGVDIDPLPKGASTIE